MNTRSNQKRRLILAGAKRVFRRKGFSSVTMKDIIDECNISRGGIYLYFSSVDEIFMSVINEHNKQKLRYTQAKVRKDKSFVQLIDEYFEKQKNRLMNMQGSLLMAMHEYRFSHKSEKDKEFYYKQFIKTKEIILELLNYGIEHGDIRGKSAEHLAVNIMYFIEGISTMAVTTGVSADIVQTQIEYIKKLIFADI